MIVKFLNKNTFKIFVALTFILITQVLLYQNFKSHLVSLETKISHRLTQVETTLNYMAKSPAVKSSIEFKTFKRVDQVVDELVFKDQFIDNVYLLDKNKEIIYNKQKDYDGLELDVSKFILHNKWAKNAQVLDKHLLMQKTLESKGEKYYLFYSIPSSFLLNIDKRFSEIKIKPNIKRISFNLKVGDLYSLKEYVEFYFKFIIKNFSKYTLLLIVLIFLYWIFIRKLIVPVNKIIEMLKNMSYDLEGDLGKVPVIFHPIFEKILEANKLVRASIETEKSLAVKEAQVATYQQVAHDIRSPLAALDMAVRNIQKVDESDRRVINLAVNRIHDIATDLSSKAEKNEDSEQSRIQPELIPGLIQKIITEKRMQYRNHSKVNIDYEKDMGGYGLFSKIDRIEFQRLVSNIINNSVEALPNYNGDVLVKIFSDDNNVSVVITDNGKGIVEEKIDSLFERGVSYEKESGSGLGLFHAKENIEKWNGHLKIESKLNKGTKIEISLPKSHPTKNFVHNIDVNDECEIVIVDDDRSIHEIWERRLAPFNFQMFSFTSPEEFSNWWSKEGRTTNKFIFFFDYEFISHKETGLDLIKKFNLERESYLVTSHHNESQVKDTCEKLSIKLVDKGMAPYIPIKNNTEEKSNTPKTFILIDDDSLIRDVWSINAERLGINLKAFSCIEEFNQNKKDICIDSDIYIDSYLDGDIQGEVFGQHLASEGFKNIYITTGRNPKEFDSFDFIKAVVGKKPPF